MAIKQSVKITIKKDGEFSLQPIEGIKGENCRETTKNLELVLGGEAISTEKTKDYYEGNGGDIETILQR